MLLQITSRLTREELELNGSRIEAGQNVMIILGTANHDPTRFPEPERLNLRRPENMRIATEEIDWWPSLVFRGQNQVPILFNTK